MSAVSGFPPPMEWSSCSRQQIAQGFSQDNLNSCLDNEPQVTVGDPVCGNGIRERDEICDCGTLQVRREEVGGEREEKRRGEEREEGEESREQRGEDWYTFLPLSPSPLFLPPPLPLLSPPPSLSLPAGVHRPMLQCNLLHTARRCPVLRRRVLHERVPVRVAGHHLSSSRSRV